MTCDAAADHRFIARRRKGAKRRGRGESVRAGPIVHFLPAAKQKRSLDQKEAGEFFMSKAINIYSYSGRGWGVSRGEDTGETARVIASRLLPS